MVKVGIEDVSEPHSYSEYTFLQCFLREPPIKEYQSNSTTYYYIFLLIIIELRKRGEKERERGGQHTWRSFFLAKRPPRLCHSMSHGTEQWGRRAKPKSN